MARKFSATEVVDLVCDNFSYSQSEEERVDETYSYRGGTTVESRELYLLAKAAILLLDEETTSV